MLLINLFLILTFLTNELLYWVIYLKTKDSGKSKNWDTYTNLYFILRTITIILFPILNSSFFVEFNGQISYFREYWIWFLILGIIIIIVGIKLIKSTLNVNKYKGFKKGDYQLITEGPYEIMRHPMYSFWALIFLSLAFIFDSFISLILSPFVMLFLGFEGFLEEKYILIPKFGEKYENYIEKTSHRLFPSPYNALLVIIAIFVVYIGILNINYILI
ncbi:MAG: methyltransferase family protein [Promethearchaeota archaeon]